ncbi:MULTISPECIES: class E sortase [unclassified Streptomyces]|uniref:class E sortase n=1 Tax=unclassified Streptomyces TaxID=2593676 RepID=UPI0029AD5B0C|nr:class E sortase [Streptomyces sp. DK15]MDX2392894.1 class E sortase [Streptomyces sp. DK15]
MRDHIRVVVQGRGRRGRGARLARLLWVGAEVVTTLGVVVALLVVHQVWWTNRQAAAAAQEQVQALERAWEGDDAETGAEAGPGTGPGEAGVADGSAEDAPEGGSSPPEGGSESPSGSGPVPPSRRPTVGPVASAAPRPKPAPAREEAYAVLRIPRLGLAVPVAQGIDKRAVLDKGYAGQYPGTAGPGERGNFALAGHRNTHGEPFRYVNRLRPGDELHVDVRGRRHTYVVGQVLNETTERDTGVIAPVPRSAVRPEYGYSRPDAYITLTTCTPEYSSKYRLVVWGTLKSA